MSAPSVSYIAERVDFVVESGSIDRANSIVRNVRVVGSRSKNGRKYPVPVLEKHLELYAAPVNVGHHRHPITGMPVEVPPYDKFGRLLEPRVRDSGIHAHLKYNPKHVFAEPFLWACENDQKAYSFSPFKQVKWLPQLDKDGDRVAESILNVVSVDIVDTGGTTSGIFESFVKDSEWVNEMAAPDAEKVAASLETDGAWVAFLTDLFAKAKSLGQATKDTIISLVGAAMSGAAEPPADGADAAAIAPAMESLRRMGKIGKWAAAKLDALFVTEANAKRLKWANDLMTTEQLPDALKSDLFTELVAEHMGNEARAKQLIAERKQLGGDKKQPVSSDRKGGAKTVKELVDGYVVG
jgi:hypothetical protein